ncbi:hypothetical protein AB4144_59175, partial [Rhizobiaceae sp. 2RAB30]
MPPGDPEILLARSASLSTAAWNMKGPAARANLDPSYAAEAAIHDKAGTLPIRSVQPESGGVVAVGSLLVE